MDRKSCDNKTNTRVAVKLNLNPEVIKEAVMKVDVSSIASRNGFLLQADCRVQGVHCVLQEAQ